MNVHLEQLTSAAIAGKSAAEKHMVKVCAERDQWREKFEQRDRVASASQIMLAFTRQERGVLEQQLAAGDQEIARLRQALQNITDVPDRLDQVSYQLLTTTMLGIAKEALAATAQPSARPMRWVEYPNPWTCEYCGNTKPEGQ